MSSVAPATNAVAPSTARTSASRGARMPTVGVRGIGQLLFTDYLFPFEVTSLLLLAALVGALTLAKRRPDSR